MRVNLRPLKYEDASISYRWRNDPEIWKYTASRPSRLITKNDEEVWITNVLAEKDSRRYAITVDEIYVGNIYLTNINKTSAEYHIFIGEKKYWGKGVAELATRKLMQLGFEELKLKRIHLSVHLKNIGARKLYKRIGFVEVGERDCFIKMEIGHNNFFTNNE